MRPRSFIGPVLGLSLAIAGPGGLAVGFFSHPTGVASHPASVYLDAGAGEAAYGYNYVARSGTRISADVWAYRGQASLQARADAYRGSYQRSGERLFVGAYLRICDPACRTFYGWSGPQDRSASFQMDPLMQTVAISAELNGRQLIAVFDSSSLPGFERGDLTYARPFPPLVYQEDWAGMSNRITLRSILFGDVEASFPGRGWGFASRGAGMGACASVLGSTC